MLNYLCQLLQVTVGERTSFERPLNDNEWRELFEIAKRQALTGILLKGIEQLPKEQWPKSDIILKWYAFAEYIKNRNVKTSDVCVRLTEKLTHDGFEVCILKGQANHVYYNALQSTQGLGLMRTCGDIDAWIWPKENTKHPVNKVIGYCRERVILLSLCHLHVEVTPVNGVPVEIHLRPSFLNAPWRDWHFQKLFMSAQFETADIDGLGKVRKLRADYDLIFQMNHIYRHLLDEGVGMRQVLDFYVLLMTYHRLSTSNVEMMSVDKVMKHVSKCGMNRFASALMFVLQSLFNIDSDLLLCSPSIKYGAFLLDEMVKAGNFGHYDTRLESLVEKKGKLSYQLNKAKRRFKRNIRFLSSYPEEVICEPFARLWHTLWRKFELYRL